MIDAKTTDEVALKTIGKNIQRRRLSKELKQIDLAKEAGVSSPTITRIEAGKSVQLVNLIRILRTLDLLENLNLLFPCETPSPFEQLQPRRPKKRIRKTASKNTRKALPWGEEE
ncbi:Transcriptional regulator, XRE family [Candidatus Terasakiella magnetica]|uniref:Transcriptional regulator, XRE family n=1 Tax=Candidatus Terasakiella magnetica TaxID=1867952 RepID=A0A1C3RE94_9PROT|nr:helix-turn-helix transcriptional regulator [Candidatus Terasakiella magnetica]SCA55544.1 Transcriptional regulator, XRE family [Candidatus Terasakiella magnetica]